MNTKKTLVVGSVLALALAACGLVPPVDVIDPLQLNGKSVTVSASPVASVVSQGANSGTVNFTFADITLPNIPFTPSQLSACYNFEVSGDFPLAAGSYTASNVSLTLNVSDGPPSRATTLNATAANITLTSTGTKVTGTGTQLCGNFSAVANAVAIISTAPTPNTVTGSFAMTTNFDLPTGAVFTITFLGGKGQVKL